MLGFSSNESGDKSFLSDCCVSSAKMNEIQSMPLGMCALLETEVGRLSGQCGECHSAGLQSEALPGEKAPTSQTGLLAGHSLGEHLTISLLQPGHA